MNLRHIMHNDISSTKKRLLALKKMDDVKIKLNGEVVEGIIADVKVHPIVMPNFFIKFYSEKISERWVSGLQIVFE